jgi:hypothetical protein
MAMTMHRIFLPALLLLCSVTVQAATCQALLVGGQPGSPLYQRRFQDWLSRSHALLVKAGVPADHIRLLSADPGFTTGIVNGPATSESIIAAVEAIAATAKRDDQFVMIILGHGTVVEGVAPRLLLPGPDLEAEPLAAAMATIPCREQVVINLSGIAGEWLGMLAAAERVNLCATSPGEAPDPVFGEFLLRAFEAQRADGHGGGAKDGQVDCLEAFTWAARQSVLWIARLRYNRENDTWKIDGKDSVAVFEHLFDGISGVPGARALDPTSDRNTPDAEPLIDPPEGAFDAAWDGRRMIDEHAMLEDCGVAEGIPALGTTGFVTFPAEELLQPGYLARRTLLGRPGGSAKQATTP